MCRVTEGHAAHPDMAHIGFDNGRRLGRLAARWNLKGNRRFAETSSGMRVRSLRGTPRASSPIGDARRVLRGGGHPRRRDGRLGFCARAEAPVAAREAG
jgi:hypothetical protein